MNPNPIDAVSFVEAVGRGYAALTSSAGGRAASVAEAEPSLGGKLLFVGELDSEGRSIAVAGNTAGAATLAATADPDAQKQAMRDGVVDFLVTSLDEALRILKNQIRKRETVAVCVAASQSLVEHEMVERGVRPDIVFARWAGEERNSSRFDSDSERVELADADEDDPVLQWQIEEAPARWMPKLDAIALGCLDPNTWTTRWLRLAARYCGRSAQGVRVLRCDSVAAKRIAESIASAVKGGEIGVPVRICAAIGAQRFDEMVLPPGDQVAKG